MHSPIFVIGVHRSGTTLLRYMLNSHPRIYIPPESDFFPRFFRRNPHQPLTPAQIEKILDVIFNRYRFVREWEGEPLSPADFDPNPTPAAFLDTLYIAYARQNDAVRWGDKTPIYSSYVDLIDQLFPTAQFVHLIRDGRDVGLSMLDKWNDDLHIDIYFTARNWTRRTREARTARKFGPARYYELHYEDLVADPEAELRPICEYLAEDYHPEMAEPQKRARRDLEPGGFHAPIRQPPTTQRVARWQREMSTADLRLFQRVAAPLLSELGYPTPNTGRMPPTERGRFAVLALKYEILQAGRNAATRLGLMPPI